jgi:hypothetical protein
VLLQIFLKNTLLNIVYNDKCLFFEKARWSHLITILLIEPVCLHHTSAYKRLHPKTMDNKEPEVKKLVIMQKLHHQRSERRYGLFVMILSMMAQHLSWHYVVLLSSFSGFYMVSAESLYLYFEEAAWCNLILWCANIAGEWCISTVGDEWKKYDIIVWSHLPLHILLHPDRPCSAR